MAALKLKGYDRATTNFPKENYHTEPFMLVRLTLTLHIPLSISAHLFALPSASSVSGASFGIAGSGCTAVVHLQHVMICCAARNVPAFDFVFGIHILAPSHVQENQHLELGDFVLRLRKWAQVQARADPHPHPHPHAHRCGFRTPLTPALLGVRSTS